MAAFGLGHQGWENSVPSQVATEAKLLGCSHTLPSLRAASLAWVCMFVGGGGSPDIIPPEEQLKLGIAINELSLDFYNKNTFEH